MSTIIFGIGFFIFIGALLYDMIILKMRYKRLSNTLQALTFHFFIVDAYLSENYELLTLFVVGFFYTFGLKIYQHYFKNKTNESKSKNA
jgi:hypothetical protein